MGPAEFFNSNGSLPSRLEIEHTIWKSGKQFVAGVDEAGRGPLAGPVIAAAVIFRPYFYIEEVRDSKKLSAKKREQLFEAIIQNAVAYAVGRVDADEIDRINIREATFKAMRKAIAALRPQPDYILFDGYELPEKFFRQEAIVKGDDLSFTIAAASIIAKVTRDRLMVDYHAKYPLYGFDRHKGYGTKWHREMVRKYGPSPIHRHTFLSRILPTSRSVK